MSLRFPEKMPSTSKKLNTDKELRVKTLVKKRVTTRASHRLKLPVGRTARNKKKGGGKDRTTSWGKIKNERGVKTHV